MKSGYGFSISYSASISGINGYLFPTQSAYTNVQTVYSTFPEFRFTALTNKYRTLEKVNGKWQFEENPDADHNERIHFTPLWFPDGDYRVSLTVLDFWTPAGMATARGASNTVTISGSAYDDWFRGR